ncbi:MFS transporter [Nocardia seriolae]|uniref:MFS transporter n=1 Tax=Nocardia seriolae TaxID=37332 RepID=A0ABC9Z158_9NOCA|nr:MFS transporter [Nocardia seriolae]OJF78717.1 MFS transporter [Nocardia seriolae]PSK28038.1 MFS transporter [Nocardia seriolae]QOW34257.1 MFS transporter [Nocardia seriolae]QUN14997.1 MFS transporter [Nocardia seriolae]WNJ58027.1 MFS transporter [Nocardia seriolae]
MPRTTRITVMLLFAAWVVDYIDRTVINFALPAIGGDLGLDHTQQGLLVSVFFIAYAIVQVPGGLLADRYGALRVGMVGLTAWSVFTGLTALAWSFTALLAVRFLFGLVQGVFPAAAIKALAERTRPEQRTTAAGWTNSSNAAGLLLAAVLAGVLLPTVGWRVMFAVISVLGVAVILAWRRWMPEPLAQDEIPVADVGTRAERRAVLFSPSLLGFAVIFFGYDVLVWGVTAWTPTFLKEQHGISQGGIAFAAVPTTLAAAVGVVLGARLSDRIGGRPRVIVAPAMAFTAAMLFVLPRAEPFALFVLVGTVMSLVAGLAYMPAFAVPLRSLPSAYIGAATGVIVFGGQLAGVLSPLTFGVVTDHVSYTTAFETMALGPLLALAAAVAVPQTADAFRARLARRAGATVPTKEVLP